MSDFDVTIPDVGEAQDVEVIEICVEIGQRVEVDDALLVIESDKASMEVPAPVSGNVKSIEVKLGDIIDTGDLVAVLAMDATTSVPDIAEADPPARSESTDLPAETDGTEVTPSSDQGELCEIRLPELGDIDFVEVIEVLVDVGQSVTADQTLVVVESDKATSEIPADVEGVIARIGVSVGDQITDNALIATIKTSSLVEEPSPSATQSVESTEQTKAAPASVDIATTESVETKVQDGATVRSDGDTVYAGPAVRRLARELGVELRQVSGSGARGRIVKDDVKLFVKERMVNPAQDTQQTGLPSVEYPDFSKFGATDEIPLTRMQARGAQNLVRSWLNVVHVTQHDEADVTELEEFRVELNEQGQAGEQRLTALPFILKACASTLREHPRFNASINQALDALILKHYIHIGVAVDTPDGLIVPVVRDVLDKGLRDIAAEVEDLSNAARSKKLTPDQISGASFTVSSLGRLGGTGFTPIINAPEVAILGVAKLATKPVWDGSTFEPRKILPLSLSYDHRAINGAEGGRFMQSLVEKLADVRRLIL